MRVTQLAKIVGFISITDAILNTTVRKGRHDFLCNLGADAGSYTGGHRLIGWMDECKGAIV